MAITRPKWPLMALLFMFTFVSPVLSLTMAYCSSINTASTNANSSIYQSDGLCHDFCVDDYAYAVVMGQDCWCSDYTPSSSTQVDTSECNTKCSGYPSDTCGGDSLYGYIALSKSASGTSGSSGTTATTQGMTSTTVEETTVTVTPTATIPSSSTSTAATTGSSATASTSSYSTYVSTVTQGGAVILQTVTVMPTITSSADSATSGTGSSTGSKSLSIGAAVGIAVGVFAFVAGVIGVGFWLWLRRKRRMEEEAGLDHRNSFRGSSAGMMSTPQTEMASVWDGGDSMGRRSSRLMPHDPRMDPFAANIYSRFENKSRESVNTLRDDQDYSRRVLRTTNPDPADAE